jgi:hypothetical protein
LHVVRLKTGVVVERRRYGKLGGARPAASRTKPAFHAGPSKTVERDPRSSPPWSYLLLQALENRRCGGEPYRRSGVRLPALREIQRRFFRGENTHPTRPLAPHRTSEDAAHRNNPPRSVAASRQTSNKTQTGSICERTGGGRTRSNAAGPVIGPLRRFTPPLSDFVCTPHGSRGADTGNAFHGAITARILLGRSRHFCPSPMNAAQIAL